MVKLNDKERTWAEELRVMALLDTLLFDLPKVPHAQRDLMAPGEVAKHGACVNAEIVQCLVQLGEAVAAATVEAITMCDYPQAANLRNCADKIREAILAVPVPRPR